MDTFYFDVLEIIETAIAENHGWFNVCRIELNIHSEPR